MAIATVRARFGLNRCGAFWAIILVTGWASAVSAATFNVNSFVDAGDNNPGNGVCASAAQACTLRAAIEETNALPSVLFNPDVINVPAGVYLLSLGTLTVTDHLRVIGDPGVSAFVDGQHLNTVFTIAGGRTRIGVELHYLKIRNGRAVDQFGGGISNDFGNLLIHRSKIEANDSFTSGGGIYNPKGSIVSLVQSRFLITAASERAASSLSAEVDSTTRASPSSTRALSTSTSRAGAVASISRLPGS